MSMVYVDENAKKKWLIKNEPKILPLNNYYGPFKSNQNFLILPNPVTLLSILINTIVIVFDIFKKRPNKNFAIV
jgi:hypothetical protein